MQLAFAKQRTRRPSISLDATLVRAREKWNTLRQQSDTQLARRATQLAARVMRTGSVDNPDLLVPGIALIGEALRRVTGLTAYDVQLQAAMVIAAGKIAEMQTGEGKTLTAAAAAFLHGLTHRGVHVSTTNAYLAQRDYECVSPAFRLLGLTTGLVTAKQRTAAARQAYHCDITYGTGYQFGFDYLRDQSALRQRTEAKLGGDVLASIHGQQLATGFLRQRGFAMAIVDEADSVLIDEAAVPLILSGHSVEVESSRPYELAQALSTALSENEDFTVDARGMRIAFRPHVTADIHRWLRNNPVQGLVRPWTKYVENAVQASYLFHRDQHYVVQNGEVQIVDKNTGRIFEDRTWREGLHQAVEAKEGVAIRPSQVSTARVTRQRFFRLYKRLSGLTGTASDAAQELFQLFGLQVVKIAPNQPSRRKQFPTRFFGRACCKRDAICDSVRQYHRLGQPVLIGTPTIEQSQLLSAQLDSLRIPHVVLNGVQDEAEARIVARAGVVGAVTVATNMAGRGTDIVPAKDALTLGGLHVIGSEHATSKRIDRQMAGRAARQGNPGSCQFFVSAEDELLTRYDPRLAQRMQSAAPQGKEISSDFMRAIQQLQARVERQQFEMRRRLVQNDAWFDSVRQTLH